MTKQTFKVFYSWQSDLPKETNQHFIRNALRAAAKKIEAKYPKGAIHVIIDEATRDCPGSPNIPSTILKKVSCADAFVADISTTHDKLESGTIATPNPNVAFELGYAVANVGWERIVLFYNKAFGKFPDDVPFDFDRQRIAHYTAERGTDKPTTIRQSKEFENLAYTAIKTIIDANPTKAINLDKDTPDDVKRNRDVRTITRVMNSIHIPTLEQHISDAPRKLSGLILDFWENFYAIVSPRLFHLYDPKLSEIIKRIYDAWGESISHLNEYHDGPPNGNNYFFKNPGDLPLSTRQQKSWNRIKKSLGLLDAALTELLAYLRSSYLEIDIEACSACAWEKEVKWKKEFHELLDSVNQ